MTEDADTAAYREALAGELRAARARKDITQADLARRTGYVPNTISRLEQGLRSPTVHQLRRIAKALDADAGKMADAAYDAVHADQSGSG